jgi:hypothetical protein
LGFYGSEYKAEIRKDKINVVEVNGKKVNGSFSLKAVYNEILSEDKKPEAKKASAKPEPKAKRETEKGIKEVERIDEEIKLIKRYALMNGKVKTQKQILTFLSTVQKAILEKRIRKTSLYSDEIKYIQDNLIRVYKKMGEQITVQLKKDVIEKFLSIAGTEKIRLSITYLKRYIGIQGKQITKEKAQRLLDYMKSAVKRGLISKSDPHADRLNAAYESLQKFVDVAKGKDTLEIHQSVLSGINDALDGLGCKGKKSCGCQGLDGIENEQELALAPSTPKNRVMNSMDFANMKFESLGFSGKWLNLIGDPAKVLLQWFSENRKWESLIYAWTLPDTLQGISERCCM